MGDGLHCGPGVLLRVHPQERDEYAQTRGSQSQWWRLRQGYEDFREEPDGWGGNHIILIFGTGPSQKHHGPLRLALTPLFHSPYLQTRVFPFLEALERPLPTCRPRRLPPAIAPRARRQARQPAQPPSRASTARCLPTPATQTGPSTRTLA